jgi:hypothetical protein
MNSTLKLTASKPLSGRRPLPAALACLLAVALAGCQGRARNDLYQQRMASEIRVLEDQLYEADYQNRVLRDKLIRCESACQVTDGPTVMAPTPPSSPAEPAGRPAPKTQTPKSPSPAPKPDTKSDRAPKAPPDELDLPTFDEGVPVDPAQLPEPLPPAASGLDAAPPDGQRMPAPGGPEPPGKSDTEPPPVEPGELLPPADAKDDNDKPPGQIQLPDSVRAAAGQPERLSIHPALSGGIRVDGKIDGMTIVVNVLDALGKTVDLNGFEVDAELSLVLVDPQREAVESRIGRWDFSPDQVADMVRSQPISGLHVPIQWQDVPPSGDEVIVHVKLQAGDDELVCEQRLKVEKRAAIAEWTPRGEALR